MGKKDNDDNFLSTLNFHEYFNKENRSDIYKQLELENLKAKNLSREQEIIKLKNIKMNKR